MGLFKKAKEAAMPDAARGALAYQKLSDGWSMNSVALLSFALHPFDDSTAPTDKAFEAEVRRIALTTAASVRGSDETTAAEIARDAVSRYRHLAIQAGDPYYSKRYDEYLGIS